jgi:hypothetical protein
MKALLLAGMTLALGMQGAEATGLVTRSMLIRACTSHDQKELNDCAGYVTGVADANDSVAQGVCVPPGLKLGLLRQGVTNWLQSHTTSDGPAAPAVLAALRGLYRCPG